MGFQNIQETIFKCRNCGKEFKARNSYNPKYNQFCSRQCSGLGTAKFLKNFNSPHWKIEMARKKNCQECDIEIRNVPKKEVFTLRKLYPNAVFSYRAIGPFQKQKFCSAKCARQGQECKRGSNHPNWTGGRSKLRQLVSATYKHKIWHSIIFERDNYICQICGERGGYKEVDHYPKSFIEIVREYNIKTVEDALKCNELWDTNNGRTLCRKCHIKTFKFFGNQFTASSKNRVKRGSPKKGNPVPSIEITQGSMKVERLG